MMRAPIALIAARAIKKLLFPRDIKCVICGISLKTNEKILCPSCSLSMRLVNGQRDLFPLSAVYFALNFNAFSRKLIMRFKHENGRYLCELFAFLMANCSIIPKDALLCPIPMHKKRKKQRGYSQTDDLCIELSYLTGNKVVRCLKKIKHTKSQSAIDHSLRGTNLKSAFRVCTNVYGKTIILIDDVCTSGSTMAECARTLIDAGAFEVIGIATANAKKLKAKRAIKQKETKQ